MSSHWRTIAALLAISTVVLAWHDCKLRARLDRADEADATARVRGRDPARGAGDRGVIDHDRGQDDDAADDALAPSAVRPLRLPADLPALYARFGPRAGEDLLAYRDRVIPEVSELFAPQRRRVDENLAAFAADAGLDDDALAAIHDASDRAAARLRDRVIEGVMSGELLPPFRAANAVGVARDLTAALDDYVQEVRGGLSDGQLDVLAGGRFDPIDYLFFATRWEEMLGAL